MGIKQGVCMNRHQEVGLLYLTIGVLVLMLVVQYSN